MQILIEAMCRACPSTSTSSQQPPAGGQLVLFESCLSLLLQVEQQLEQRTGEHRPLAQPERLDLSLALFMSAGGAEDKGAGSTVSQWILHHCEQLSR